MKKYYSIKEHKKDEKRMDKQIINNVNNPRLTTEQKIRKEQELQKHLASKKKVQTAEMPKYEYANKKTGEIITITRELSLELKRKGVKLIPVQKEEKLNNEEDHINLTIDLTKVKREKWAQDCWTGNNLINTNNNLQEGKGIIEK